MLLCDQRKIVPIVDFMQMLIFNMVKWYCAIASAQSSHIVWLRFRIVYFNTAHCFDDKEKIKKDTTGNREHEKRNRT